MEIRNINPEKISFGTINPRKDLGDLSELAYDLKQRHQRGKRAVVVPLMVKELKDDPTYDYELIDGKRRLQSALSIRLPEVPVVLEDEVSDYTELVVMSIKANEHRKDFNWAEEAIAYEALRTKGLTQEEIGNQMTKSVSYISERIATYIKLKNSARAESLGIGTARYIARDIPEEDYEEVIDLVLKKELSERDTMKIIKNAMNVIDKLEQIEDHEELHDKLGKIYLPKRYTTSSANLLQMEIELSTGHAKARDEYLETSKFTEEEAKEFAKEHYGEFLGKTVIEVWRVYVVPLSRSEIRAKLGKL